jgi:hypothetical protein
LAKVRSTTLQQYVVDVNAPKPLNKHQFRKFQRHTHTPTRFFVHA